MISKKEATQDMGIGFYVRARAGGYIPLLVRNFEVIGSTEGSIIVVPMGVHFAHEMQDYITHGVRFNMTGMRWGLTVNLIPNNISDIKDTRKN